MNDDHVVIEPRRVRALFARTERDDDFISREIASRMRERLDYIRIDAQSVLDAGCGSGADLTTLRERFPGCTLYAMDSAQAVLARARARTAPSRFARWLSRTPVDHYVCADFARAPLPGKTIDLIWSNLALHWHPEPHQVMPEWARLLKVGGLVMFSAFGPDTLREVRAAFKSIDHYPHSIAFTDMHDYGDMLSEAGFAAPVMDMERVTLTYAHQGDLWRDVRALGGNALLERRRGLLGRNAARRLEASLDDQRDAQGRLCLSFEVVYGHAWRGEPRKIADGRTVVKFDRPSGGAVRK